MKRITLATSVVFKAPALGGLRRSEHAAFA
jgi:hypothetical protein